MVGLLLLLAGDARADDADELEENDSGADAADDGELAGDEGDDEVEAAVLRRPVRHCHRNANRLAPRRLVRADVVEAAALEEDHEVLRVIAGELVPSRLAVRENCRSEKEGEDGDRGLGEEDDEKYEKVHHQTTSVLLGGAAAAEDGYQKYEAADDHEAYREQTNGIANLPVAVLGEDIAE